MSLTSQIDNIIGFDRQLNNLWELQIIQNSIPSKDIDYETNLFKLFCKSVDLPNTLLDISTSYTGRRFYNKVTQDNTLSFEVWNDDNFKSFSYFNDWFETVYDKKNACFKSFNSQLEYEALAERTMIFTFQKIQSTATSQLVATSSESVTNIKSYDNILIPSYSFKLNNVKILGIENFSQDYEKGEGMSIKVRCTFDYYEVIKY